MRALFFLLLVAAALGAQITTGTPPSNYNGVSATPLRAARPARPISRGIRRPLIWGGFDRSDVIVVKEAAPVEEKKPAYPPALVLNPVWEKEKITPKLIEIP
jgi:hypothetical protein